MAVTFDATTAGNTGNGTSLTFSHTVVSAGANGLIIVGAGANPSATGVTFSGVTYAAAALTQVPSARIEKTDGGGSFVVADLWSKLNEATGANNVVITASTSTQIFGGATSWTSVDSGTPLGTAVTNTGTASPGSTGSITCPSGGVIVGMCIGNVAAVGDLTSSDTQRWRVFGSFTDTIDACGASRTTTGALTWAFATGGTYWAATGVPVNGIAPTAALTGTATATITEADVVAGGKTIILTLTNDTYVAAAGFQTIALRGTGKSGNAINGGNVTLTFDVGGGAPQTGDYVVVFGGHGTTVTSLAAPGAAAPADGTYTQVGIHTGTAPIFGAWIKKMGATPDTKVVCSGGGNAADAVAYGCWVFSGVDLSTPQDQTATTAGPTTSTNPNGASITTVTDNAWVVTMAGSVVNDSTPGTISGYTNQQFSNNTDTSPFTASGMTKLIAAHGADDPAAYSSWSSGAWYAITMALRPAATTPFADARAALITGIDSAQSEAAGWDAKVKANLPVANVVRTSDTVCTVTLQAQADYDITAQETITATIPASILSGGAQIVATPTFTIDPAGGGGDVLMSQACL